MEQEKKISLHPRRLARKMAKAQLDRRGASGYNKHGPKAASTFANTWRNFAIEAMQPRKKKGAKK
ncbi:MAG: hypothetical protein J6N19_09790 [Clostridium sp.]|nr:hypothetical protein [Clostridium sp.]